MLFSGTLRMNLDPAGIYSDDRIWKSLEMINLKIYVSSLNCGLQYVVEEGGSNFRYVSFSPSSDSSKVRRGNIVQVRSSSVSAKGN